MSAIKADPDLYQHIDPGLVGNGILREYGFEALIDAVKREDARRSGRLTDDG